MNNPKAVAEFTAGMQNIERAIIAELRATGIAASAIKFQWNRGKSWMPIPDKIYVEVTVGRRKREATVLRLLVDDSCDSLDPRAVAIVQRLVGALTT